MPAARLRRDRGRPDRAPAAAAAPVRRRLPDAVVIHPGAGVAVASVAGGAVRRGRPGPDRDGERVVVTGQRRGAGAAAAVVEAAGLPPNRLLAGDLDLAGLAALVADARLVVCGDTGVAHLASAYATPSVLLFGPTPPDRWGPPASGPHRVLWSGPDRRSARDDAGPRSAADHGGRRCSRPPQGSSIGSSADVQCRRRHRLRPTMRILLCDVHGGYTDSFIAGSHEYWFPPADADGRGGLARLRGRADPPNAHEVARRTAARRSAGPGGAAASRGRRACSSG